MCEPNFIIIRSKLNNHDRGIKKTSYKQIDIPISLFTRLNFSSFIPVRQTKKKYKNKNKKYGTLESTSTLTEVQFQGLTSRWRSNCFETSISATSRSRYHCDRGSSLASVAGFVTPSLHLARRLHRLRHPRPTSRRHFPRRNC